MLIKEPPRFRAFFPVWRSSAFPFSFRDSLAGSGGAFEADAPAPPLLVDAVFLVSFGDFSDWQAAAAINPSLVSPEGLAVDWFLAAEARFPLAVFFMTFDGIV